MGKGKHAATCVTFEELSFQHLSLLPLLPPLLQANIAAQASQTRRFMVIASNIFPVVRMFMWSFKVSGSGPGVGLPTLISVFPHIYNNFCCNRNLPAKAHEPSKV